MPARPNQAAAEPGIEQQRPAVDCLGLVEVALAAQPIADQNKGLLPSGPCLATAGRGLPAGSARQSRRLARHAGQVGDRQALAGGGQLPRGGGIARSAARRSAPAPRRRPRTRPGARRSGPAGDRLARCCRTNPARGADGARRNGSRRRRGARDPAAGRPAPRGRRWLPRGTAAPARPRAEGPAPAHTATSSAGAHWPSPDPSFGPAGCGERNSSRRTTNARPRAKPTPAPSPVLNSLRGPIGFSGTAARLARRATPACDSVAMRASSAFSARLSWSDRPV